MNATHDLHIASLTPLPSPVRLRDDLPMTEAQENAVTAARADVEAVLRGDDDRLLVVVGPCSVHDPLAAVDYARRLAQVAEKHRDDLLVVMRVYFEKPRSTGGWKGLINDPALDGTHDVARGVHTARRLLLDVIDIGLPVGCEFLEPISPQYIADTVAWGAIGARTTESQIHRQLASGLSMPVGFKNATDGDIEVAIDGCTVASQPHVFFGTDEDGAAAVVSTTGNGAVHIVLRGGRGGPNYGPVDIERAAGLLERAGRPRRLVVDASHANSGKDHLRQAEVVRELASQIAGTGDIAGIMIESFLVGGSQTLSAATRNALVYGQSVTDACIDWETTAALLGDLAAAARIRREGGFSAVEPAA
ncbi:MAG: 3-deoxy-7-phosphoheptulonate synthase [Tessaracoccus sp.]|uniref:3-deoxy-7-phosphoheptulonate synthase n=1 Tax=Tessaracoccus sp. TaxID=1971211 RepID=UPI001EC6CC32|nr:3-deoxy-7-phosphoheptulonate synthase [Tessaracoccus sp.]MBK7822579.1 3-deoxy-7-phosphoheptulonate synthase [Tessaracoccus sp.]